MKEEAAPACPGPALPPPAPGRGWSCFPLRRPPSQQGVADGRSGVPPTTPLLWSPRPAGGLGTGRSVRVSPTQPGCSAGCSSLGSPGLRTSTRAPASLRNLSPGAGPVSLWALPCGGPTWCGPACLVGFVPSRSHAEDVGWQWGGDGHSSLPWLSHLLRVPQHVTYHSSARPPFWKS